MKRWWLRFNSLPVRLFLCLWAALVLAHYLGYGVQALMSPGRPVPQPPGLMALSPADGLPPPGARPSDGGPPDGRPPGAHLPDMPPPPAGEPRMPLYTILIDYGVRVLIFGLAAALLARWVSRPLSRLQSSASALEQQVIAGTPPRPVPEHEGPQELRDVAAAYNRMSERLVQQFEQRSMMMAAVSHDLRTPLTRMRLRLEQPDSPARTDALRADLSRMDHLIGQVLASVRAERHEAAQVSLDLASFAQACVDDHADAGRPVEWGPAFAGSDMPAAGPAVVQADPVALQRVLDNLIDNAVRHGHRARVSVARPAQAGWQVWVDDEGPGIDPAQLERLMQPFARLDQARREQAGAGLGLYIARQLAERQGAQLVLSNRPGGGLRAALCWPSSGLVTHGEGAPPEGVGKLAGSRHF
jgi:protein-histidine pros-kinase